MQKYFANLEEKPLAEELWKKISSYYDYLETSGLLRRMRKAYRTYYGLSDQNGANTLELTVGGSEDELSFAKGNHYRNINDHWVNFLCGDKPDPKPVATNTSGASIVQTALAEGVLEYYTRKLDILTLRRQVVKHALITGEGGVQVTWDGTQGEQIALDPESMRPVYEGDIKVNVLSAVDIVRDPAKPSLQECNWFVTRTFMNRYELAAIYPALEEKILAINGREHQDRFRFHFRGWDDQLKDELPVFEFFHKKTAAVPKGKHVILLGAECVLSNGDLPYKNVPVHILPASELLHTPHGDSPLWQILGLQELHDLLFSAAATNNLTFGVQNVKITKGHNLSLNQIEGGMNLWEVNPGTELEGVNLTKTAPETYTMLDRVVGAMEMISGINEVVRGKAAANLRSGDALAMMHSEVTSFTSGSQAGVSSWTGSVYTSILHNLQSFCPEERKAILLGESGRYAVQFFSGEALNEIDSVLVDSGDAQTKTGSQRLQLAQLLINLGARIAPEQLIEFVNTGKWETVTEHIFTERANIRLENEAIRRGESPPVLFTDNHVQHILGVKQLLDDPEARKDPGLVERCAAHIQGHMQELTMGDPMILQLLGQPVPPPMPVPGAEGGTPPPAGGAPGGTPPPPEDASQNPTEVAPGDLPDTPTGEPVDMPGVT